MVFEQPKQIIGPPIIVTGRFRDGPIIRPATAAIGAVEKTSKEIILKGLIKKLYAFSFFFFLNVIQVVYANLLIWFVLTDFYSTVNYQNSNDVSDKQANHKQNVTSAENIIPIRFIVFGRNVGCIFDFCTVQTTKKFIN